MFDFLFAVFAIAAAAQSAPSAPVTAPGVAPSSVVAEAVTESGSAQLPPVGTTISTGPAINQAVIPAGLVAEPQIPSGKFTTAAEVKPILNMTKGNWVALRDYDGQDLLYVTHLWSWRCGLSALALSLNGEPMQNWPLPPCHSDTAAPNAIIESDGPPYLRLKKGGVQSVTIQIVYDDLSTDVVQFERKDILMP